MINTRKISLQVMGMCFLENDRANELLSRLQINKSVKKVWFLHFILVFELPGCKDSQLTAIILPTLIETKRQLFHWPKGCKKIRPLKWLKG